MNYLILTEEEREDMILNTLRAQEVDHFMYSANVARYQELVNTLPEGDLKTRVSNLLVTETKALEDSEKIIEAINKELPEGVKLSAAITRLRSRIAKERGETYAVDEKK